MPIITKCFSRIDADQFEPVPGNGLIEFTSISNVGPEQTLFVPHVCVYCPTGGIGDVAIYWRDPGDVFCRVVIGYETQVNLQQWDGSAVYKVCPGVAPRHPITIGADGTPSVGRFWDLVIETQNKADFATASYSINIAPLPNEAR